MATAPLEIRVIGELTVLRGGQPVRLPPSKKTRALLGYLLLTGRVQRRERLCSLLWDVTDDPRAALRWCLSKLRSVVDDDEHRRIVADRERVELKADEVVVDAFRLRDLCARLGDASVEELEEVAGQTQGELLEGLDLYDFHDFHAWCIAERMDTHRRRVELIRSLAGRLADEPERALPWVRELSRLEPVDVDVRVQLVELLRGMGRVSEAISELDAAERTFRELGKPEPDALRRLRVAPVAVAPPTPSTPSTPPPDLQRTAPRSPLARTTIHGLRLVGRRAEIGGLAEELDRVAETGTSRAVLIKGEPGVGKSRLLVELMTRTRTRRGSILEGSAYEAERSLPYVPFSEALRRMAPGLLSEPGSDLSPLFEPEQGFDTTRERLYAAVAHVLEERARAAPPLLVALDDLQWFDEPSIQLLHYIVRTTRRHPILFAMTARGGEISDNPAAQRALRSLHREAGLTELELGPMERDEIASLVSMVATAADGHLIFHESGGNPLFALEVARSGSETLGSLAPSIGRLVSDRVERLEGKTRDVLRWAAVLGPVFRVPLLQKLVSLPVEELADALEELEARSLIGGVVDPQAPGEIYQFAHYIVYRAVHSELSIPRRRLMHSRVAAALGEVGDAHASELAHHAMEAGDAQKAASAAAQAARSCLRLFAPGQAIAVARRGMRYAETLDEPSRSRHLEELQSVLAEAEAHNQGAPDK